MGNIFTSSIGKKLMMSLAGLFLVVYLLVHLGINLLVIIFESTQTYNAAAHFMGSNPLIKVMEIVLFAGFLLHIVYGIVIHFQNLAARGKGYKISGHSETSYFSKYMAHTAFIILVFLVIHLAGFFYKAKFTDEVPMITYEDGKTYLDLGGLILERFKLPVYAFGYVIAMFFLGFHLHHGFQSAFQTLGMHHKTYSPIIKTIGIIYTLVIVIGFSLIPIVVYFFR